LQHLRRLPDDVYVPHIERAIRDVEEALQGHLFPHHAGFFQQRYVGRRTPEAEFGREDLVEEHQPGLCLGDRIDAIIDAGSTAGGAPSTVVQITSHGPRLIRAGAIVWERVLESLE